MATHEIPQLDASVRADTGKRSAARLRKEGRLPGVVYGHGQDPVHVAVDSKALNHLLHENAHLLNFNIDGNTDSVLIKDVQWDFLGDTIIHADFTRVNLSESVTVEVELEFVGEAVGLKENGAYIEHPTTMLEVECRADSIPSSIRVNISEMNVGDTLSVADVQLPDGVTAVTDEDTPVAAIHMAAAEEEEAEGLEEAAAGEPEVIGAKKEEDEGGEG